MRKIELSLETATRWYNGTDAELKGLALQTYPELGKKELPKSWEEANRFIDFQCDRFIALGKLEILRDIYNDGWVADWANQNQKKYVLQFFENRIDKEVFRLNRQFFAFKDAETRDLFLENFEDLMLTAKPLLG